MFNIASYRMLACLISAFHQSQLLKLKLCLQNPGRHVSLATTRFCTMVPNICGSSAWNLLHVIHMAPRILRWFLDVRQICAPLLKSVKKKNPQNIALYYKNTPLKKATQLSAIYYRVSFRDLRLGVVNGASGSQVRASAMSLRVVRN